MRFREISELCGRTPCLQVSGDPPVFLKLEGTNPTGSVKDRACLYLIQDALRTGELRPGRTLLDASSGNMACAIAFYGRRFGYRTRVVASSKLTAEKAAFIRYFGAELDMVGQFTIEGNQFCRELKERKPAEYCFLDQLHNWANVQAHIETTGPEILADFPEAGMVVGSLGSGGTMCGVARYLRAHKPDVRVVAVQSAPGTRLPGTGSFDEGDYVTPFIHQARSENLFCQTVRVSEAEAIAATQRLREHGIFAGLQTGGVMCAAEVAMQSWSGSGAVVVISGDSGWKNLEKLQTV